MSTRLYPGISRSEYEKIDAMNISTLIHGKRSMAHLKHAMSQPAEMTDALRIGIATHIAVFEPNRVESTFFIAPKRARRSNEDKQWWADFEAKAQEAKGVVLTEDEAATIYAMRDALRANEDTRSILDAKGVGELGAVWNAKVTFDIDGKEYEETILCKGMIDRFCDWMNWPLIPDLKTCQDASVEAWPRIVANFDYGVKAAWYLDGMNQIHECERRFIWIAIEKAAPHCINLHEPDEQCLAEGRAEYRRILRNYARAKKTGVFEGYAKGINPTSLPKWALNKGDAA